MKRLTLLQLTILVSSISISASAAEVIVLPGDPNWGNPPGENGGGGSSAITATAPRSGNGSLELHGDRTRFFGLGNPYSQASNLGLLSQVTTFTFDWQIALDSLSALDPDYTPALRLHIWDNGQRSELIWEGAYNSTYGNTTKGQWYTSGADDNFWQYQTGIGGTAIYDRSISDWKGIYSQQAYVAAVSVGAGSSVGPNYKAFADNVTLGFGTAPATTYNFEASARSVPDVGSTLSLLGSSILALGAFRRFLGR